MGVICTNLATLGPLGPHLVLSNGKLVSLIPDGKPTICGISRDYVLFFGDPLKQVQEHEEVLFYHFGGCYELS